MSDLLDTISKLAGDMRRNTFVAAAEFILAQKIANPVETGTYRGCDGDGESTVILATLAAQLGGRLTSIDINPGHIQASKWHIEKHAIANVDYIEGDSVTVLGKLNREIRFIYLDSFDHDPKNPGPCQRHELAEMGAVYGKLVRPCGILLDDNMADTGGKPLLGAAFLKDRGWKLVASGYQFFFIWE